MQSIFRATLILVLITVFTLGAATAKESRAQSISQRIAEAYGIEYFDRVDQIRYTFNVQLPDKQVSRSWLWEPKTDKVIFTGGPKKETVTYHRKDINDVALKELKTVDGWFINDNYWLLFPLRVAWDRHVKVEEVGLKKLPMGEGNARCVIVTYPATGGYTPGDVYELFINADHRITQWIYRQGGSQVPTRVASWEDYKTVGPLTISLDHRGEDGKFRVWFTDVHVKLAGASDWIPAK